MTRILLVDDEPEVLRSTAELLRDLGFEVHTTSEPREVLPLLRVMRPDLLLQDIRMPGLDLDALVGAIRADATVGATPILLFSASLDAEELAAAAGAQGHVPKPFRPEEIETAVARVVRRSLAA